MFEVILTTPNLKITVTVPTYDRADGYFKKYGNEYAKSNGKWTLKIVDLSTAEILREI